MQTAELPVIFDTTRSDTALTAFMRANGDAGWYQSDRPDIKGMLRDKLSVERNIRFDTRRDSQTGSACLSIGQIAVTLRLQAKIYVASGYNRDTTYFSRIFTHEDERLTGDRALLKDYAPRFQQGLQLAYSQPADYALPPLVTGAAPDGQAILTSRVNDSLNVLFNDMLAARSFRQRAIDTEP